MTSHRKSDLTQNDQTCSIGSDVLKQTRDPGHYTTPLSTERYRPIHKPSKRQGSAAPLDPFTSMLTWMTDNPIDVRKINFGSWGTRGVVGWFVRQSIEWGGIFLWTGVSVLSHLECVCVHVRTYQTSYQTPIRRPIRRTKSLGKPLSDVNSIAKTKEMFFYFL